MPTLGANQALLDEPINMLGVGRKKDVERRAVLNLVSQRRRRSHADDRTYAGSLFKSLGQFLDDGSEIRRGGHDDLPPRSGRLSGGVAATEGCRKGRKKETEQRGAEHHLSESGPGAVRAGRAKRTDYAISAGPAALPGSPRRGPKLG